MDRIVGLFEQESRDRVDRLLWTGWVVTSLILAALAAIGMFVLRPAALLIRRQLDALARTRRASKKRCSNAQKIWRRPTSS